MHQILIYDFEVDHVNYGDMKRKSYSTNLLTYSNFLLVTIKFKKLIYVTPGDS